MGVSPMHSRPGRPWYKEISMLPMPQHNFLNLPAELSDPKTARYFILPAPYEGTVSYAKGTADGPSQIIDASAQVELFDDELQAEFHHCGVATLPMVPPSDTPEEEMRRLAAAAGPVIKAGKFLLTLGGEHSISYPLVKAAVEKYGEISVLQVDAHADLRDTYEHSRHSHACIMRRVLEMTPRIAQVGIRNYSLEEFQQCPTQVANFITPRIVRRDPKWIDRALSLLAERVYLSIDIDGLDPAEAPGTGTPEPGGLHWLELLDLLRRLCVERTVVSADIVEVRPLPPSNVTEFLAARLAYKIIAYTQLR
jgi:agmatinase